MDTKLRAALTIACAIGISTLTSCGGMRAGAYVHGLSVLDQLTSYACALCDVREEDWKWDEHLSPMDIDRDGKVELPLQSKTPVPDSCEADWLQVIRNVVTHEMGHCVRIVDPEHCKDPTCIMFERANNWRRDGHFCKQCRAQMRIHNE